MSWLGSGRRRADIRRRWHSCKSAGKPVSISRSYNSTRYWGRGGKNNIGGRAISIPPPRFFPSRNGWTCRLVKMHSAGVVFSWRKGGRFWRRGILHKHELEESEP